MSDFWPPQSRAVSSESDAELLCEFVRSRSEEAFAELVSRHAAWVQGVTQRILPDRELAREVTQNVFVHLARKAGRVEPDRLGPWLHRTAVFECRNAARRERTRQQAMSSLARQSEPMKPPTESVDADWHRVLPVLDAAVNALPESERALVVQRFLQQRSWREIGTASGRSEDSARMALAPALEKLHHLLQRRGVTVPIAVLAAALTFSGKSTALAATAVLSNNALASAASHPVAWWRGTAGSWLSTAACLVVGSIAGYQLNAPPTAASAETAAITSRGFRGGVDSSGRGTVAGTGFDLAAVLDDLRSLEPSGNEMELVVRLRAALIGMPATAVAPIMSALRTSRWGRDSTSVAAAFFCRWAELDVDAASAAFRQPEWLGALDQTLPAIFDGMPKDDPAGFVRLLNTFPDSPFYSGKVSDYCAQFPSLTLAILPYLSEMQDPGLRAEMCQTLAQRVGTAADCELLATAATGLPSGHAAGVLPALVERWALLDAAAVREWIATLPRQSPQYWAAVTGEGKAISAHDAAAAGRMIAGIPWINGLQKDLKTISRRWIMADREGAVRWLTTKADIPSPIRDELLKSGLREAAR